MLILQLRNHLRFSNHPEEYTVDSLPAAPPVHSIQDRSLTNFTLHVQQSRFIQFDFISIFGSGLFECRARSSWSLEESNHRVRNSPQKIPVVCFDRY